MTTTQELLELVISTKRSVANMEKLRRSEDRVSAASERLARKVERTKLGIAAIPGSVRLARFAMSTLFIGLATGQVIRKVINVFGDFEEALIRVQGISKATEGEFNALAEASKQLGITSLFNAAEVGKSEIALARAGFSATEVLSSLADSLDLATVANIDTSSATSILTNTIRQFNLDASESTRVVDALTITSNSTNTAVQDLGNALKFAGTAAASVKDPLEAAAAELGVLADRGLKGTKGGTALRQSIIKLINPTKRAADTLRRMGLTLDEVNPEKVGTIAAFKRLGEVQITLGEAARIFSTRTAVGALILSRSTDRVQELTVAMEEGRGETERLADAIQNSLNGRLKLLLSSIEGVILRIGDNGLGKSFSQFVANLTDGIRVLGGFDSELIGAREEAEKMAQSISTGLNLILLATLYKGVSFAIGSVIAQLTALKAALLDNPVTAIPALVALAVGAIITFREEIFGSGTSVSDLGGKVTSTFKGMRNSIRETKSTLENLFPDTFKQFRDFQAKNLAARELARKESEAKVRRNDAAGSSTSFANIADTAVVGAKFLGADIRAAFDGALFGNPDAVRVLAEERAQILTDVALNGFTNARQQRLNLFDKVTLGQLTIFAKIVQDLPKGFEKAAKASRDFIASTKGNEGKLPNDIALQGLGGIGQFTDAGKARGQADALQATVERIGATQDLNDKLEEGNAIQQRVIELTLEGNKTATTTAKLEFKIEEAKNKLQQDSLLDNRLAIRDRQSLIIADRKVIENLLKKVDLLKQLASAREKIKASDTAKAELDKLKESNLLLARTIELTRNGSKTAQTEAKVQLRLEQARIDNNKELVQELLKLIDLNTLLASVTADQAAKKARDTSLKNTQEKNRLLQTTIDLTLEGVSDASQQAKLDLAIKDAQLAKDEELANALIRLKGLTSELGNIREEAAKKGNVKLAIRNAGKDIEQLKALIDLGRQHVDDLNLQATMTADLAIAQATNNQEYIDAVENLNRLKVEFSGVALEQDRFLSAQQLLSDSSKEFLTTIIEGTDSLGGAFKNLFRTIAQGLEDRILTNFLDNFFSAGSATKDKGGGAGLTGFLSSLFGGSQGAILSGNTVVPFARGGIISQPTIFPLAGQRTGLAGEAGLEGLFKVTRDSQGDLAVKGVGAGGRRGVTIVQNITTPNADSFRKSRRQLQQDARGFTVGR